MHLRSVKTPAAGQFARRLPATKGAANTLLHPFDHAVPQFAADAPGLAPTAPRLTRQAGAKRQDIDARSALAFAMPHATTNAGPAAASRYHRLTNSVEGTAA